MNDSLLSGGRVKTNSKARYQRVKNSDNTVKTLPKVKKNKVNSKKVKTLGKNKFRTDKVRRGKVRTDKKRRGKVRTNKVEKNKQIIKKLIKLYKGGGLGIGWESGIQEEVNLY